MNRKKCIVHGCTNHTDEGGFVGEVCAPCFAMLETSIIKAGTTFIHRMQADLIDARDEIARLRNKHND